MRPCEAPLMFFYIIRNNYCETGKCRNWTHLPHWQADINTVMSWFSSPVYSRYWQHYQQAMAWHQRHRRAYRKALGAAYGPGFCQEQPPSGHQRYADWRREESEEEEEESSSDSEIECDVSNMEISEELRQYFAQTEKHREELSKKTEV